MDKMYNSGTPISYFCKHQTHSKKNRSWFTGLGTDNGKKWATTNTDKQQFKSNTPKPGTIKIVTPGSDKSTALENQSPTTNNKQLSPTHTIGNHHQQTTDFQQPTEDRKHKKYSRPKPFCWVPSHNLPLDSKSKIIDASIVANLKRRRQIDNAILFL